MGRYGEWRPLAANWASQPKLARVDLLLFHTMVGSLSGTDGYFRRDGYGGAESHFGVGHDGTCYQWQDTAYRAEANGAANARAVSVETADIGTGFAKWNTNDGNAVPAWTPQQIDRLVDLTVWTCRTHGIPCVLIPDSKPGRRGIGYHRLGVPGYAVAGGELWSSARGKVCPGPKRIAQIPSIVFRAAAILNGVAPVTGGDSHTVAKGDTLFAIAKRYGVTVANLKAWNNLSSDTLSVGKVLHVKVISAPPVAPTPAPGGVTLSFGSRHPDVWKLQQILTTRYGAYSKFKPDGIFGPMTLASVKEFQRRSKLTPDGVVGPATRRALGM